MPGPLPSPRPARHHRVGTTAVWRPPRSLGAGAGHVTGRRTAARAGQSCARLRGFGGRDEVKSFGPAGPPSLGLRPRPSGFKAPAEGFPSGNCSPGTETLVSAASARRFPPERVWTPRLPRFCYLIFAYREIGFFSETCESGFLSIAFYAYLKAYK